MRSIFPRALGIVLASALAAGCTAVRLNTVVSDYERLAELRAESVGGQSGVDTLVGAASGRSLDAGDTEAFRELAREALEGVEEQPFSFLGINAPSPYTRLTYAYLAERAAVAAGPDGAETGHRARGLALGLCEALARSEMRVPHEECGYSEHFYPIAQTAVGYTRSLTNLHPSLSEREPPEAPGATPRVIPERLAPVLIHCRPTAVDAEAPAQVSRTVPAKALAARQAALTDCYQAFRQDVLRELLGPIIDGSEEVSTSDSALARLNALPIDRTSKDYYAAQGLRMLCVLMQVDAAARRLGMGGNIELLGDIADTLKRYVQAWPYLGSVERVETACRQIAGNATAR